MASSPRSRRWILPAVVVLLWLVVGGPLGSFSGKLSEVQTNDNSAFLPQGVESTKVLKELPKFTGTQTTPATVVFERTGGLTASDKQAIDREVAGFRTTAGVDAAGVGKPVYSADGEAAQVTVPLTGQDQEKLQAAVDDLRSELSATPTGLVVYVGGQGGILADFSAAFGAIDGILLLVAVAVVLLILLVVYRSPVLPVVVLLCSVLALGVASAIVYALAKNNVLDLNGQSQGILFILAIGAATDYSLLLVARFREELRDTESKYDAMRKAYRRALEPILASGITVILGLLCLLLSSLTSLKGLGPVGAFGVGAAMFSSLTLLPAVLLLLGRRAYWPIRPSYGSTHTDTSGLWGGVARGVGRHPRRVWIGSLLLLGAGAAFLPTINEDPAPQTDLFLAQVGAVKAQDVLDAHFTSDTASPALIITPTGQLQATLQRVKQDRGVVADSVTYLPSGPPAGSTPPPPKTVDGDALVFANLEGNADGPRATGTVARLRGELNSVDASIRVGGTTAIQLDTQTITDSDRQKVIPAILLVIFVVLSLLLRALVAPLLLLLANVLSFAATLGIAALVFNHVFGFPTTDPTVTLIGFVFLVAFGVDYSIFLMTRVREESAKQGTRPGVLRGLSVTGGVITSAGIVLAATFAALGVIPILFLAEIAFIVAFGVLLDTIVVRSLLVPALATDIGSVIWWPSRLRHVADEPDAVTATMLRLPGSGGPEGGGASHRAAAPDEADPVDDAGGAHRA